MKFYIGRTLGLLGLLCLATLLGCGGGAEESASDTIPGTPIHDDHDHHGEEHATFDEAVHELVEMRNAIRDGVAAGDEEAFHGPLHEVGHVLESLESFAEKMEDSANKTAAVEAVESLFDLFGKVDAKLHGGDGVDYSDVADEIDANVSILEGLASGEAAAPTETKETKETTGETADKADADESAAP